MGLKVALELVRVLYCEFGLNAAQVQAADDCAVAHGIGTESGSAHHARASTANRTVGSQVEWNEALYG